MRLLQMKSHRTHLKQARQQLKLNRHVPCACCVYRNSHEGESDGHACRCEKGDSGGRAAREGDRAADEHRCSGRRRQSRGARAYGCAWLGSVDISINKAFTARAFDISTKELAQHSQSGGQFFGIHVSNHGRVMIFAGGVPLRRAGRVVGAVGVSGGSGEQDQSVAEAAAKVFE